MATKTKRKPREKFEEPEAAETQETVAEAPALKGLISGRIVHLVGEDSEHRPAVVTKVHTPQGRVNLHVFLDHSPNDVNEKSVAHQVEYSEEPEPGTWHFLEHTE